MIIYSIDTSTSVGSEVKSGGGWYTHDVTPNVASRTNVIIIGMYGNRDRNLAYLETEQIGYLLVFYFKFNFSWVTSELMV